MTKKDYFIEVFETIYDDHEDDCIRYERAVDNEIKKCYERVRTELYSDSVDTYFTTTSDVLKFFHERIRATLNNGEEESVSKIEENDFTMIKLNANFTRMDTTDVRGILYEPYETDAQEINEYYKNKIYSSESDDVFMISGKNYLKDIFTADQSSYFQHMRAVIETLESTIELNEKIVLNSGYQSDGGELILLKSQLNNLTDGLEREEKTIEDRCKDLEKYGFFSPKGMVEYVNRAKKYRDEAIHDLKNNFTKIKESVDSMVDECDNLTKLNEEVESVITSIEALIVNLEDAVIDSNLVINGYTNLTFETEETYIDKIVKLAMDNYMQSGAGNFSEISANSILLKDENYVKQIEWNATLQLGQNIGLIDSDVSFDELTEENIEEYINLDNFSGEQLLIHLTLDAGLFMEKSQRIQWLLDICINKSFNSENYDENQYIQFIKWGAAIDYLAAIDFSKFTAISISEVNDTFTYTYSVLSQSWGAEYSESFSVHSSNDGKNAVSYIRLYENDTQIKEVCEKIEQLKEEYGDVEVDAIWEYLAQNAAGLAEQAVKDAAEDAFGENGKLVTVLFSYYQTIEDRKREILEEIEENEYYVRHETESNDNESELADDNYEYFPQRYVFILTNVNGETFTEDYSIHPTKDAIRLKEAAGQAAIISQGEGAEGYKEAMEASYATAVENGSYATREEFEGSYTRFAIDKAEQLQEMSKLSVEEIVERYDEFKDVLREIDDNLKIIKNN
ncbi:MAG: hypothetical protein ACK5LZ_06635 [Anaerorhabdus sp.]